MISLSRRLVIVMAVAALAGSSLTALSWARGGPGGNWAHGLADPPKASEAGKKGDDESKARATFMTSTNEVLRVATTVSATAVAVPAGFKENK